MAPRPAWVVAALLLLPSGAHAEDFDLVVYDDRSEHGGKTDRYIEAEGAIDYACGAKNIGWTRSFAGFKSIVESAIRCNNGNKIKSLRVQAHGDPGRAGFLDPTLTADDFAALKGFSPHMAPGAKVMLASCGAGGALKGAQLLRRLGQSLLGRNGGEVKAPLGDYYTLVGLGASPKGYRTYTVPPNGEGRFDDDFNLAGQVEWMHQEARSMNWAVKEHQDALDAKGLQNTREVLTKGLGALEPGFEPAKTDLDKAVALEEEFERWSGLYRDKFAPVIDAIKARAEAQLREKLSRPKNLTDAERLKIIQDNMLRRGGDHVSPVTGQVDKRD